MLMGDLITLAQERLPVKVVIFNNGTSRIRVIWVRSIAPIFTAVILCNSRNKFSI
jgi:thiamine pyrophosphate-dependent acetolactate synthase large subunit-like protein